MTKIIDLTGQTFGSLHVLKYHDNGMKRQAHWLCRCNCGSLLVVRSDNLLSGKTTQCSECRASGGKQSVFVKEEKDEDELYRSR